jgi:hypothetical protein
VMRRRRLGPSLRPARRSPLPDDNAGFTGSSLALTSRTDLAASLERSMIFNVQRSTE